MISNAYNANSNILNDINSGHRSKKFFVIGLHFFIGQWQACITGEWQPSLYATIWLGTRKYKIMNHSVSLVFFNGIQLMNIEKILSMKLGEIDKLDINIKIQRKLDANMRSIN